METTLINLQQLYIMALSAVCQDDKLDVVIQPGEGDTGRLWLMRKGTTVPQGSIAFKFGLDDVTLAIETRSEHKVQKVIAYSGGLDSFLPELQKILRAGMLAAPTEKKKKTVGDYETRVRQYEAQGMTRSDAQAVVEAEDMKVAA